MLGSKASVSNDEWLAVYNNIENIISEDAVESATQDIIAEIELLSESKNVAYAWSGGKDSLVLGDLCERAGVTRCMMGRTNLEYPEFMDWVDENKPSELFIMNSGYDINWLSQNLDMLFPDSSALNSRWLRISHNDSQRRYYQMAELDMMIFGRRIIDGNSLSRESKVRTLADGRSQYNPLTFWSHEEIFGYIHYNGIELPPIYEWSNGFVQGTHQWAQRKRNQTIQNTWAEVYEIDSTIPLYAMEHIESAKLFMESIK